MTGWKIPRSDQTCASPPRSSSGEAVRNRKGKTLFVSLSVFSVLSLLEFLRQLICARQKGGGERRGRRGEAEMAPHLRLLTSFPSAQPSLPFCPRLPISQRGHRQKGKETSYKGQDHKRRDHSLKKRILEQRRRLSFRFLRSIASRISLESVDSTSLIISDTPLILPFASGCLLLLFRSWKKKRREEKRGRKEKDGKGEEIPTKEERERRARRRGVTGTSSERPVRHPDPLGVPQGRPGLTRRRLGPCSARPSALRHRGRNRSRSNGLLSYWADEDRKCGCPSGDGHAQRGHHEP